MNKVLNENERLLEQVINKDIVNIIMNSSVDNASVNVHECEKCLKLETELLNKKDFVEKEIYDKLFKSFTTLEKHCISLEVDTQLNQEIFQRDNSVSNQSAPSFDQLFELNELKAQSQEKDTVIKKLKERIKSLSGKMNEDKIKKDLEEIETINIELDHRVSKLIAENEHLKQTYKQLYDSIKPARIRSKEQCDDLINQVNLKSVEISDLNASLQERVLVITALKDDLRKLKGKTLVDNAVTKHTIDPEMLKIDVEPITPKLTMDITRDQQIALDDALVAPVNQLKIGKTDDPEIYMQEFWATATVHHHSICFKMNNKKHIMNLEYFREMLQICPKLPDQQFKELSFEEGILTFLKDLGHSKEIKVITDVNVNKLHQPWRSFAAVINKCMSDYAYLLWEDFIYQVENKNVKRSNEMYYPHFTKVIVNFFMTKDSSIPRRNRVNWHFARDDPMFTTIKVVSRHEDTQLYGAIFPNELTNEAIKDSESYKEYYAIASGSEPPKIKASVKKKQTGSDMTKTPPTAKGKRLKTSVTLTEAEQMELSIKRILIQTYNSHASGSGTNEGTGDKPGVLDVPTYASDDEQISWKSSDEEDDDEVAMSGDDDDDADNQDDDDNDDDDQNDDNTDNENDDNDDDDDDGQDHEEVKEEEGSDLRVQTPCHYESTNDEESETKIQGTNVEGDEMDKEETSEEEEVDELYRDVNVNLEGRDTEMTNALRIIVQTTQVIEDTHVIITRVNPEGQQLSSSVSSGFVSNMLNPSPDTSIDFIFNLNTESTSLVDVQVTTIAETPLSSATTLPPPPTPLILHLQQTPVPTPATVPSSSLQDLPNFGSLFGFDHRLKTLENDFSEFKQTNQFAVAVSLILGIVDMYLANKMNEAVKTAVQLQSDRLRDEAQADNEDFINKLDDNIKKIIKEQVKEQVKAQVSKILPKIEKTVNEQLEAEVLTRSSNESKTSHAIAANLFELELKKILIDKMESNKSIHRSDEQKNLYKALVDAYKSDKLILDTYGDTVSFKRRRDDEAKDEEPSAGSNWGVQEKKSWKRTRVNQCTKGKDLQDNWQVY
ncbi:hypothetical protein Tco_0647763 [Tanacetum coccineum]